jgi:hypothetical protein
MAKFTRLVNGFLRSFDESGALPAIQEGSLTVVASSPGPNEILAVTAGTNITLPASITYTDTELNVFFDGQKLIPALDYNYVGSPPRSQITLTFDLAVGDVLFFEKERDA